MAGGWTHAETKALIDIWREQNVQEQLDNVRRNKDIYVKVAKELADLGYSKTWKQCRVKVKNLTQKYRKVTILSCLATCTSLLNINPLITKLSS